jgi:hypothetical protein
VHVPAPDFFDDLAVAPAGALFVGDRLVDPGIELRSHGLDGRDATLHEEILELLVDQLHAAAEGRRILAPWGAERALEIVDDREQRLEHVASRVPQQVAPLTLHALPVVVELRSLPEEPVPLLVQLAPHGFGRFGLARLVPARSRVLARGGLPGGPGFLGRLVLPGRVVRRVRHGSSVP